VKADTCGCCELPAQTPVKSFNRPGLAAIVFRVGTYSSFRLSMLQRIANTQALSALQTRSDDDYAVTLLDMWATVADVLTFYQERIANESYLRTALQRDSVLRMARMLDYHLSPGIAATTFLAFSLDKAATLQIPVGLRVQSVPAQDEKPQIYETLESILADASLNSLRILPPPEASNALERGSTSGILAPGPESMEAAAAISPGDRLVLFDSGLLEELIVRELRVEEDRISLVWSGPIQELGWNFTSEMRAFNRTFRIFGYNAPSHYMEAVETSAGSGDFFWTRQTFTASDYAYPTSGNVLELDSKYEGIAVGSELLIAQPGLKSLATVIAISQGQATFLPSGAAGTTPVQDTVTRVTLSSAPSVILDRRNTIIYEIKSPPIRFWGYRYPERISGPTVFVPGHRLDPETVEIGRTIENKVLKPGLQLSLKNLEAGREVVLRDATQEPTLATVTRVAAIGLDVSVSTTSDDLSTAIQLRLTPEESLRLSGLRSAPLPTSIVLTKSRPQLSVTIGGLPARTISLGAAPTSIDSALSLVQASLASSVPLTPEFAQARIIAHEDTLIILPGVADLPIAFGPTAEDTTSAGELGLTSPDAQRIDALLSGVLAPFPVLTNPLPELLATFGPIGPRKVVLRSAPGIDAERALQFALANADLSPAFARVLVMAVGSRLLIVPGTGGSSIQDYLAITLATETPINLDSGSAVLFGNVAIASHGEKVSDEVLGDGDASAAFQKFELQKTPLTYIPSAGPGGTESALEVLVNDVLWTEVPSLFGKGPSEQVYTTRLADDGTVTVGFGDGRAGARLPSGRGNLVADYRQGSGLAGRVATAALRNPLDLPVGLKSATNPLAATGGADPESIEQARENAPTTVRTFGRAVSLRDFEDLACSSGEVAKALATWVWNREARAVHLTIAAQAGQLFSPSDLVRIHTGLNTQRDPNHALFLDNYSEVPLVIKATVRVKSNYVASKVGEAARQALLQALSFDSLRFGQPVALSDVYAVLQQVDGVSSVDVDQFQFKDQSPAFLAARGATSAPVQRMLRIFSARPNSIPTPPALPAELAAVETPAEDVQIVTSGGLPD
jgi:hypothetical protein